ncbi:MAG TPA: hypothetical protein VIQ31_28740 [Phormidium sp.]
MSETEVSEPCYQRCPVQVLGCLRNGEITVILFSGIGLVDGGILEVLPAYMIPVDLRMPNSQFDVLFDRVSGEFVKILRNTDLI